MAINGRRESPRTESPRKETGKLTMSMIDELRRRIEMLENHGSGIGSEVAVVKAEVGSMQRDINYLRTSAETMSSKIDHVLTNITSIQTRASLTQPRDPIDFMSHFGKILLTAGGLIAMVVAGVQFIAKADSRNDEAVLKAINGLADRLAQAQSTPPPRR
jgi:hypothetical protein